MLNFLNDYGIWLVIGLSAVVYAVISLGRHSRDYSRALRAELAKHGLNMISSRKPKLFESDPFPTFEVSVGTPISNVGGVRGEYQVLRVVTCADEVGREFDLWALLDFQVFKLHHVRWRSGSGETPKELEGVIES